MNVTTATRPGADEHLAYYGKYIALATETDAIQALERQLDDMLILLRGLDETTAARRYAPDKWSIKQVLGHLIDSERVFAYRALRFARADATELPGFDENTYAVSAGSDQRPLAALIEEITWVRRATLALFRGFDDAAWLRRGSANGSPISVRALAFVIAGHGRHHMAIVRERYLAMA